MTIPRNKFYFVLLILIVIGISIAVGVLRRTDNSSAVAIGTPVSVGTGNYINIAPKELTAMLQTKDFTLINVHIPYEGEIANTDAKIAYNEIDQKLNLLPADKSARIVLYCRSGRMSTIAAEQLVKLGYTHIFNLDGGMIAWQQAGYPLLNH